jgi:hypothetical protein
MNLTRLRPAGHQRRLCHIISNSGDSPVGVTRSVCAMVPLICGFMSGTAYSEVVTVACNPQTSNESAQWNVPPIHLTIDTIRLTVSLTREGETVTQTFTNNTNYGNRWIVSVNGEKISFGYQLFSTTGQKTAAVFYTLDRFSGQLVWNTQDIFANSDGGAGRNTTTVYSCGAESRKF